MTLAQSISEGHEPHSMDQMKSVRLEDAKETHTEIKWDSIAAQGQESADAFGRETTRKVREDKERHLVQQLEHIEAVGHQ